MLSQDRAKLIQELFEKINVEKCDEKLFEEAIPLPAIPKPVPWSGDVLTKGKFIVTFTALSNSKAFRGANAWSWYIETMLSNSPFNVLAKTVSGGKESERLE